MEKCMRSKQNKLLEKYKQFFIESEKKMKNLAQDLFYLHTYYIEKMKDS